jgi:hypothetical protein
MKEKVTDGGGLRNRGGGDQIEDKPAGELDGGQISGLADLQSRVLRCLAAVGKP